jgi:hypothetical protein
MAVAQALMLVYERFGADAEGRRGSWGDMGTAWTSKEWAAWDAEFDPLVREARKALAPWSKGADFGEYEGIAELVAKSDSSGTWRYTRDQILITYPILALTKAEDAYNQLPAAAAEAGLPCTVIPVDLP